MKYSEFKEKVKDLGFSCDYLMEHKGSVTQEEWIIVRLPNMHFWGKVSVDKYLTLEIRAKDTYKFENQREVAELTLELAKTSLNERGDVNEI